MMWPQLPDYGCIARWPQDGFDFIHPDDTEKVRQLFPSNRVFRRERFDGRFYHCRYGEIEFRLQSCLWIPVSHEGFDLGDRVETTGVGMVRELFVGTIANMYFAQGEDGITYRLRRGTMQHSQTFSASMMRLLKDKKEIRPVDIVRREADLNVGVYELGD